MLRVNRRDFPGRTHPTRIIQFGEGNFLRAFIDWQIDLLNEHTDLNAGIVVVRPRNTPVERSLNQQDGLYTTLIRGVNEAGEIVSEPRLIRSVNQEIHPQAQYDAFMALARDENIRLVFSNTTESGISYQDGEKLTDAPAASFPAKLTQLLYARWQHFNGDEEKGWVMLPCELIEENGPALRALILRYAAEWALPAAFAHWVEQHNTFCSTLVDRIVTGYPEDAAEIEASLGYRDGYLVAGEVYYLLVIQGPAWLADLLRYDRYPLNIKLVEDIGPYKEQKVAILNGAHTAMVPVAFLAGLNTVGEAMEDVEVACFIDRALREEIIPALSQPAGELNRYADAVMNRFRNPFIRHQLQAIALNSMTKFRTRLLPQLLNSAARSGHPPVRLSFALAALLAFFRGQRGEERYPLQDDAAWLTLFADLWAKVEKGELTPQQLVEAVLSNRQHWGEDLTQVPGLTAAVTAHLQRIIADGMRQSLVRLNQVSAAVGFSQ